MSENDKPVTIDGQTIQPKWPWSPGYRAAVREALTRETPAERARAEAAEDEYARDWAERRGIPSGTAADLAAVKARIRAVQR